MSRDRDVKGILDARYWGRGGPVTNCHVERRRRRFWGEYATLFRESAILSAITVNCGAFHGGLSANLVPAKAEARFDIRLPAVVCGLTPHNLGGADEYIQLEDLRAVGYMHALSAFDFLSIGRAGGK